MLTFADGTRLRFGHPWATRSCPDILHRNLLAQRRLCMCSLSLSSPQQKDLPRCSAHLQALSTEIPSTDSPSVSSLSSLATAQAGGGPPTAQQIHTARILLALLSAPPTYALPLNTLKEVLSQGGGAVGTRPIYACVAKRLLKIERGGGEQVVKFDV